MTTVTSQLLVRLIDGVSGPAKAASASLRGLNAAGRSGFGGALVAAQTRLGMAVAANRARTEALRGSFFDAAASAYMLRSALGAPIGTALKFDNTMEDIRQKLNYAPGQMQRLGKEIASAAEASNQGIQGMAQAVDFLAGMGLDVEKNTAAFASIGKAATAYRADIEDLAKAGFAAIDSFKVAPETVMRAFDAMAKSGKEGGFEIKDMAKHFPALGAAALSLKQTGVGAVSDFAAALQIARKGAADADTAANNMMNFLQKITLKETQANFKKFGVSVSKELEKAQKKGVSVVEHFLELTDKVTEGGKADKLSLLFGDKQVLEFLRPLLANMAEYRRIRSEALNAAGESERDFTDRMKTWQAQTDRLSNSWRNFNRELGSAILGGGGAAVVGAFASLLDTATALVKTFPAVTSNIVLATGALVGLRIAAISAAFSFSLLQGGALMIAGWAVAAARPFAWLVAGLSGAAAAALRFSRVAVLAFALGGVSGALSNLGTLALVLAGGLWRLVNPLNAVKLAAMTIGAVFTPIGATVAAIGATVAAIAAAGTLIYANWSGLATFFSALGQSFMANLGPAKPLVEGIASAFGSLSRFMGELVGSLTASDAQWKSWGETVGGVAAGAVNAIASGIQRVIGLLSSAAQWASNFGNAIANAFDWSGKAETESGDAGSQVDGKRAAGGFVSQGSAYLVGERGREIFVPGSSGRIVPNGQGGGSVTVSPSFTFNITGNADAAEIERRVRQALTQYVSDAFRGVQADVGLKFA